MIGSAKRLYHTVAFLKPVQIYRRPLFRLWTPRPNLGPAPPCRPKSGRWTPPIEKRPSLVAPARFRLLNSEREVAGASDWSDPTRDKLWLYNLHYFDDLNASEAGSRREWHEALLDRWISENPPPRGVGWEPYPVSLRIVNWIKWALAGQELGTRRVESLAVQARWLEQRLEWHLLGNHLLSNAKALLFAGAFFDGGEAERWRQSALTILGDQIREQILADGGHFELSPMYHAIVLEDLLDVINLGTAFPDTMPSSTRESLADTSSKMLSWLAAMTHPDGRIAFFNDAAFGVAAEPSSLRAYAFELGLKAPHENNGPVTLLEDSGYCRLEDGEAVALLDVGPIGPDHLPGHAHADTLSFELSLGKDRVIVNGGTSVYEVGPQRHRERSTAAHSTVEIDGENSSEVWAGFRVARRARILDLTVMRDAAALRVGCAHDGYRRLPGRPVHRREWILSAGTLQVSDGIQGRAESATARFHLGPNVEASLESTENERSLGRLVIGRRLLRWQVRGQARLEQSFWHPEFGSEHPVQSIVVPIRTASTEAILRW